MNSSEKDTVSAVVTGQAGVGKTAWIYYALRRRLGEGKPVMWYFSDTWYLFENDGVLVKPDHFYPISFKQRVWVLVDHHGEAGSTVPGASFARDPWSPLFVILACSPNAAIWKGFERSDRTTTCIMDLWTRQEMHQLWVQPCPQ